MNETTAKSTPKPGLLHKNDAGYQAETKPWENDALNRKPVADDLTNLVASIRQPFVISIDAPYGGGKTYFLKNWQRDLDADGYLTVYFNAWETDYSEDPLLPFMAAISRMLEDMKGAESDLIDKKILEEVGKKWPELVTKAGGVVFRSLARRAFGDDVLKGMGDLNKIITEKNAMKRILSQQAEDMDGMISFREQLKKTISELTEGFDDNRQKLIVFVDELDRCRPNYAVSVLERIKHFFAVPGMVVVLGIAEKQVAHAMSAVYGVGLDTDGYLKRFIDWRFNLPNPTTVQYTKFLSNRFFLPEIKIWSDYWPQYNSLDSLLETLIIISEALGLPLRKQEQNFTEINLYLRTLETVDSRQSPFSCVVGFLAPLRADHKDLFDAAFAPQVPGERELSGARKLFDLVKDRLETGTDPGQPLHRQELSRKEGLFLSWFATERTLAIMPDPDKQTDEYEKNVWMLFHKEVNAMRIEWRFSLDRALADIVRQRLDNAGKLLQK